MEMEQDAVSESSQSHSSVSQTSVKKVDKYGAYTSVYSFFLFPFIENNNDNKLIIIFLDEGGPRRSTRADYETAIAATGNNFLSFLINHY